jgi:O-antigen ligase
MDAPPQHRVQRFRGVSWDYRVRFASRLPRIGLRRGVDRRSASRRGAAFAAGVAAVAGAEACVLLLAPGLAAVVLAGTAVACLSRNPRLGPLGAALAVVLAIPFGRAADLQVLRIGAFPLRPQDAAIAVGVVLAMPGVFRTTRSLRPGRPLVALSRAGLLRAVPVLIPLAFLGVGCLALAVGLMHRYDWTDVVRDVRWWFLYGAVLLVLWQPARTDQLVRGLMSGAILFSLLMIATALLPAYDGALKDRALEYDWGQLRLQFSNDPFVLAALAYSAFAAMRQPTWRPVLLAALFTAAITLSLTRTSMLVSIPIVGCAILLGAASRRGLLRPAATRAAVVAGSVIVAGAAALTALSWLPLAPTSDGSSEDPQVIGRITFTDPSSDLGAVEAGRFEAYRKALAMIQDSPLIGEGFGSLINIGTNFGNAQAAKPGYAPGVDDAYLTTTLKAGVIGLAAFAALLILPLPVLLTRRRCDRWLWYLPVWLGLMALTVTQSYACSGYGPFPLALLLAAPLVACGRTKVVTRAVPDAR